MRRNVVRYSLKQLRYFVAAGQTGSVTKAADLLCVSQPSISSAIVHLEDIFEIQLFIRHHAKGLALTPGGKKILAQAKMILKQAEELQNTAHDISSSITGLLDIAFFVTLAPVIAPSLIRDFQEQYENVRINCFEADQDTIFAGIHNGKYDLALTYRLDIPAYLEFESLSNYEPYVILHKGHPLASETSISLKQLEKEPLVMLDLQHSRQYFESVFNQAGFYPNIAHRSTSPHLVRSMVTNGMGYSIMNIPIGSNHSLDGKEFVKIRLRDDLKPIVMGIVKSRNYNFTKTVNLFYEHCKNYLTQ